MAPHSSTLVWKLPWTEEPRRRQSMGVSKSWTQLSNFTFTFHFHALEKEMATHSSVLAWRIPETGEAGGLPSMGSHRIRHDWSDLAAASAVAQMVKRLSAIQETWVRSLGWEDPWRRKWQPTSVFFPGKSHGLHTLVGYRPWGRKESDTTERQESRKIVLINLFSGQQWGKT